jgi:Trypsin-like peptidase domain
MNFRSIVLFALSLVLFTGCLSLARPSKPQREAASARAAKELLAAHHSEIEKSTFLVYASDCPASFAFTNHGDKGDFKFTGPMASGLAAGISDDGYLLTAAHVAKEHCYVMGWMDGKLAISPVRVIYKKFGRQSGAELAILHVGKHLDCPIKLGTLDPAGNDIYAFASDRQPAEVKIIAVAGKIIRRPEPKPNEDLSIMATDLPLWLGDSGGAVMSKDGKLVGIFTAVSRSLATFKVSRLACVPDMDRVLAIIEADRLKAKEPNPAPAPATTSVTPRAANLNILMLNLARGSLR